MHSCSTAPGPGEPGEKTRPGRWDAGGGVVVLLPGLRSSGESLPAPPLGEASGSVASAPGPAAGAMWVSRPQAPWRPRDPPRYPQWDTGGTPFLLSLSGLFREQTSPNSAGAEEIREPGLASRLWTCSRRNVGILPPGPGGAREHPKTGRSCICGTPPLPPGSLLRGDSFRREPGAGPAPGTAGSLSGSFRFIGVIRDHAWGSRPMSRKRGRAGRGEARSGHGKSTCPAEDAGERGRTCRRAGFSPQELVQEESCSGFSGRFLTFRAILLYSFPCPVLSVSGLRP